MTPALFVLAILLLFAILVAYETAGDQSQMRLKPLGLLSWLVSGNWPAKVGGGLVIIGVGALLRYAMANVNVPPELKLGSGVAISAVLGVLSAIVRKHPQRRAIHLALAGAAFGVAYLTAYSAYGFFGYINDINALALLGLVAIAAGTFAVNSNAMSVAILAMVGAYIAPRFALGTPGLIPVYGYYLAASILSLVMVTLRGWRPLIHLSFLFTLAGALFFGWSGKFYGPQHYSAMQPMLLALTAVHLAMPLLEQRHARSTWLARFDTGYFLLLPFVAAMLTLKIAPDLHTEGGFGLAALALIWAVAAVVLFVLKKGGVSRHATIAVILGIAAVLCFIKNPPWVLGGLALSVAAILAAPRMGWPRSAQEWASGLAIFFGALHVVSAITSVVPAQAFENELFAIRMIASVLLILGGWVGKRRNIVFSQMLFIVGCGWLTLSILAELLRLHIDFLPQLCYGLAIAAIFVAIMFSDRLAAHPIVGGVLVFVLIACGWWAVRGATQISIITYIVLTPLALLAMAWDGRDTARENGSDFAPSMAIGLLPFALMPWASALADVAGIKTDYFEVTIAMAGIAAAGLSARLWLRESPRWNQRIQPLHVWFTAIALFYVTLFHIERGLWPVLFELLALTYLMAYVIRRSKEPSPPALWVGLVMAVSVGFVLQAMILRGFGPDRIMNAADINRIHLPAVISLMWTIFGGGIAWWATRMKSRPLWSAGSVLLVVAAVKLVLLDFGELGQLGNILAFIAAGVVFLGVAWLAPIPPKAAPQPRRKPIPEVADPFEAEPTPQPSRPVHVSTAPEEDAASPQPAQPAAQVRQAPRAATASARPERTSSSVQSNGRQRSRTSNRYREEPKSYGWLWFFLLGMAIVVAVLSSAWRKHEKRAQAMQEYRKAIAQQTVRDQPKTESAQPKPSEVVQVQIPKASEARTSAVDTQYDFPSFEIAKDAEVVLISGYEPTNRVAGANVNVHIDRPRSRVLLVLTSYEKINWNVTASSGTTITGILVSGHYKPTVTTEIDTKIYPSLGLPYAYETENAYFRGILSTLNSLLKIDRVNVFRGSYTIPPTINISAIDVPRPELSNP